MDSQLDDNIDQLRQMTTAQLRLKYQELFGQTSHSNHKDYLFRRLAWRIQALAQGGLSERARRYAQQITQDAELRLCPPNKLLQAPPLRGASAPPADSRLPASGTLLVKRYKNDTISVTVLEHGFQYGERIYKSLSAIARQVTGTQWNGYSFFGLSSRKGRRRASQ
jgi:Protein of unknown function (DUF2924)